MSQSCRLYRKCGVGICLASHESLRKLPILAEGKGNQPSHGRSVRKRGRGTGREEEERKRGRENGLNFLIYKNRRGWQEGEDNISGTHRVIVRIN